MRVELDNVRIVFHGDANPVTAAIAGVMVANGAMVAQDTAAGLPDILVLSLPLLPTLGITVAPIQQLARATGAAMAERGHGRIIFVLSAAAAMPMRRHPDYSMQMAAMLTCMRTLAMQLGPAVLVNALGVGAVGDPLVAGDPAMIGHSSVGRAGVLSEVADTALFLCDPLNSYLTGQMVSVDGGWSAGYGRNF